MPRPSWRPKKIRRLPVVVSHSAGQRLAGIVSATDIFRAYPPSVNPFGLIPKALPALVTADEIMNRHPLTITPEAPIEEAARVMRDHKIGALPVVQADILAGLITESDIFRAFVDCFDAPLGGVRVTFYMSQAEGVLELVFKEARLRGMRVLNMISAHQHDRPVCEVQVASDNMEAFVGDLWKSGHHLLNVLRLQRRQSQD
jgi:acetoin utilization protein AcuB